MMKVIKFDNDKINFVDDDNNFVGYDLRDDCCAHGDWFISDKVHDDEPEDVKSFQQKLDFPDYQFDRDFFKDISSDREYNAAVFRLESNSAEMPTLYLHLYNCHNGYYGKGFVALINGYPPKLKEGTL